MRARVEGTDSGLHVVVWLDDIPRSAEGQVVAKAKAHGVGTWPAVPSHRNQGRKVVIYRDRDKIILGCKIA